MADIALDVPTVLQGHPAIRSVQLAGSRQRGTAGALSDWDFDVDVADFAAVAAALPALVVPLEPLAKQWDPLSRHGCYMLLLRGGVKIDLLFEEPQAPMPPWHVSRESLPAIDAHFWDWILWLASKDTAGKRELVAEEFVKMLVYLLRPLGVTEVPDRIDVAIKLYIAARAERERRLSVAVPKEIENDVRQRLRAAGYEV